MFLKITATIYAITLALLPSAYADDDLQIFNSADPSSTQIVDNTAFATFLDAYAGEDADGIVYVAYGNVTKDDHLALKTYLAELTAVDPRDLSRDEAFAYWANLYNALTLDVLLDEYPVDSIRDIRPGFLSFGPWKKSRLKVLGIKLSLDNIEHDILRAFWRDPRVHYAVNCASIGCPNLPLVPLTGAGLEETLDAAAVKYINHPRGVHIKDGEVSASSIYKWFSSDFGDDDAAIIAHWREYAGDELKAALEGADRIDDYDYDWSLNERRDTP